MESVQTAVGRRRLHPQEKRRRYCHRSPLRLGGKARVAQMQCSSRSGQVRAAAALPRHGNAQSGAQLQAMGRRWRDYKKKQQNTCPALDAYFYCTHNASHFQMRQALPGFVLSRSIGFFFDTRRTQWQQRKKLR
ncbi:MAG: hypothetical protein Q4A97_05395 [Comamonadaceae bacterium]|nr:hypothetical protein [Comamonadaceae bacterium]